MYKVIEINEEVGNEILQTVNSGILINVAKWSGPSLQVRRIIVDLMPVLAYQKLVIIDHDKSEKFQEQFIENGQSQCHGWCDIFIVENGTIIKSVHKLAPNKSTIKAWLSSRI